MVSRLPSAPRSFRQSRLALAAVLGLVPFALALTLAACAPAPAAGGQIYQPVADAAVESDTAAPGADVAGQAAATLLPSGDPIELANNSAYFARARDVIQTAQTKLRIVQFNTGLGDGPDLLVAAVIKAKQRGVNVWVLLDEEVTSNKATYDTLKAAGVNVKFDGVALRTHAKIVASEQGFVIGSTNWSSTSMTKNNETNVLVRDGAAVTQLHSWLDKLWAKPTVQVAMPTGKSTVAKLYADGGYASVAGPAIDAAKTRILLCTYGMNIDPGSTTSSVTLLADKLGKAVKRGVKILVLLDQSGDWAEIGNDINAASGEYLKKLGVTVYTDPVDKITHAKFLVVDDAVVLGSNNWGYGGFESYHEVGLKTSETKVVAGLVEYFEKIWTASSPLKSP